MIWTLITVAVFLALMVGLGVWTKKYIITSSDFLLAGREMSFGINMMGVVASGFAGTTISLAPAWTVMWGFKGWLAMGLCYGIFGVSLYGLLFARVIRRSGAYTLPEWLEMRFDYRTRRILSITGIIGMIAVTANNVLALANVISGYFSISLYISIAIGVITFMAFTYSSGMWGVSLTDFAQALIGIVGCPILIIGCLTQFGDLNSAFVAWQGTFAGGFMNGGINGGSLATWKITYPAFFTILLNFGVFLVWGGQHYWMRMAGARSEKQAQNAYLIAGFILFLITLVIASTGIFAGAYFPQQFTLLNGPVAPTAAYGFLIANFPAAMGSFLLLFALAASLSTAATTLMASVNIAVKDIYPHFIKKNPSDENLKNAGRWSTIIIGLLAWFLAYYPGGTTFLFAFATAWMAPAGLMFALGMWWRRCTPTAAFIGALCALIAESTWALMDILKIPFMGQPVASYPHLSILGVVCGIIPAVLVSYFTRPKYYGRPDWQLSENINIGNISSHTSAGTGQ